MGEQLVYLTSGYLRDHPKSSPRHAHTHTHIHTRVLHTDTHKPMKLSKCAPAYADKTNELAYMHTDADTPDRYPSTKPCGDPHHTLKTQTMKILPRGPGLAPNYSKESTQ